MRWMTASPIPFSAATIGSRTGSAYGATIRTVMCAAMISAASHPPYDTMSGGTLPFTTSPTQAEAPTPTIRARTSRNSSAPRRRRWTKCMRAPVWDARWAISAPRRRGGPLVRREPLHGALGVVEAARADAVLHGLGRVGIEEVDLHVAGLVGGGEVEARDVGLYPAEDRHHAVLLADVVLVLAPAPGGGPDHPGDAEDAGQGEQPDQPGVAVRCPGGVSGGLRVGVDRERHPGRQVVGDLGRHRLALAGVAGAVTAEERRTAAGLALQLGRGPDHHRDRRLVVVGRHDDVGDDAGDVVGAAGLEAGPHQLDGGVVGGAAGEDGGEPAVVERPGRAVAAEQDPVVLDQLHGEQVGIDLVDAVEGLQDQVAVGVGAGVGLADAPLVDQALHERVVAGELADLAVAVEVGAAVTDMAHGQADAVEECDGGGGARAAEGGLVVDEGADPVGGAVQGAGHQVEPGLLVDLGVGWLVESTELADRRARGQVTARGPTDPVADREEPGPGVPGVLVVLADATDVGDRGVLESECHFRSSRMVFPIRTWVPRARVVGWVIRALPM